MGQMNQTSAISATSSYRDSGFAGVVSTKLNKPSVPSNYVTRKFLFERFDKNIHLPLTLVSAATGCGKSTIGRQWFKNRLSAFKPFRKVNMCL